ncbi:Aste57867_24216 [Aphanomyces stellatus]|uniref:Aste57867_24216 protein n=1 Tax=Aphanomyces stellatus TaxID=120398 RepID=A0A485LRF2_9STRA|nr:hypothetical protein As57867_024141 [Aphanomyces stellatus]VFU00857.1 Aste57867_24216 [Aphanomyces stellatus]
MVTRGIATLVLFVYVLAGPPSRVIVQAQPPISVSLGAGYRVDNRLLQPTNLSAVLWRSASIFQSDAVAIRVHFANLSLPPGLSLVARTLANHATNLSSYFLSSAVANVHSPRLFARFITLELIVDALVLTNGTRMSSAATNTLFSSSVSPLAVVVDKYDYVTSTDTASTSSYLEQGCGTVDSSQHAVCAYDPTTLATMYTYSRAVVRIVVALRNGGTASCTGWLWGSAGHVLTTSHCVGTSDWHAVVVADLRLGSVDDARTAQFEFAADAPWCQSSLSVTCGGVTEAITSTWITSNSALDYTLLRLPPSFTSLVQRYGYLRATTEAPAVGTPIYIPQHPRGGCKLVSATTDKGNRTTIRGVNGKGCDLQDGYFRGGVVYDSDTDRGSSGAPVLHADTHAVVALHYCGGEACQNAGIPLAKIIADLNVSGVPLPPDGLASSPPPPLVAYADPRLATPDDWSHTNLAYRSPPLQGVVRRLGNPKKPYLTSVDIVEVTVTVPTQVIVDVLASEFDPESLACFDLVHDCRITSFQATLYIFSKFKNVTYKAYSNAGVTRARFPYEGRLDGSIASADPYLVADLPPGTHVVAIGGMGLGLNDAIAGVNTYRYVDLLEGNTVNSDATASAAYQLTISSSAPITLWRPPPTQSMSTVPNCTWAQVEATCAGDATTQ